MLDMSTMTIVRDARLGRNVVLRPLSNLYDCTIGDETRIGALCEIQSGVLIGARCKIQDMVSICTGTTIEDEVFVGPGVIFTNDPEPAACTPEGEPKDSSDWICRPTRVCRGAAIGANATIGPGVTIGEHAFVGAGSVVIRDVPPRERVFGNPARRVMTSARTE